mgnify:FL=1
MLDPKLLTNLPDDPDVIAPDGSEIRLIKSPVPSSSMVHVLLHQGTTTHAVYHVTVEEQWLCVAGEGELWKKDKKTESITKLRAGVKCNIPLRTIFQFRSTGNTALEIILKTTPPWPGETEAVRVKGKWKPRI